MRSIDYQLWLIILAALASMSDCRPPAREPQTSIEVSIQEPAP